VGNKIGVPSHCPPALAIVFQSLLTFGDVSRGPSRCYRGIAGME